MPAPAPNFPRLPVMDGSQSPGWQKKFIDPHALATEAMRKGQPQKAFEILNKEIERQRSGRGASNASCNSRNSASARARTPSRSPCWTILRRPWKPTSWKTGRIAKWWRECSHSCCRPARRSKPTPRPSKHFRAHLPPGSGTGVFGVNHGPLRRRLHCRSYAVGLDRLLDAIRILPLKRIPTRTQSVRQLKEGLRRDLEWLLNTRRIAVSARRIVEGSQPFAVRLRSAGLHRTTPQLPERPRRN